MNQGGERTFSLRVAMAVLIGMLTFMLGVFLGALSLMSQKVQEISAQTPDDQLEPGRVYYRKGSEATGRWRMKRNELVRGSVPQLRFSESDLNEWARHHFSSTALPVATPPAPAAGPAGDGDGGEPEKNGGFLWFERKASPPNFAFVDGQLQISTYIEVPEALGNRRFLYQAIGGFERDDEGRMRFVPAQGSVGQAPLVSMPFLGPKLHSEVAEYFTSFPEWAEIDGYWERVTSAAVEGEELVLTLQPASAG